MIRVLVCGGRDYADERAVFEALDRVRREAGIAEIIHGGASGADALAARWARETRTPCTRVWADWKTHGRAAGPIRNRQMLEEHRPDLVVAFPGQRGTADMMRQARAAGVRVWEPIKLQEDAA